MAVAFTGDAGDIHCHYWQHVLVFLRRHPDISAYFFLPFRTVRVWLKRDTGQYWPSICHSMPSKYCHNIYHSMALSMPSPDLNLTPLAAFLLFCWAQRGSLAALGKKRKKAARGVRYMNDLITPSGIISYSCYNLVTFFPASATAMDYNHKNRRLFIGMDNGTIAVSGNYSLMISIFMPEQNGENVAM